MNEIQIMKEIQKLQDQINSLRTIETGGIWTTYTPTPTGYSSTTYAGGKYCVVGRICHVYLRIDGTSNSTSFSALLPKTSANFGYTLYISSALAIDNTAQVTTASTFIIPSSAASVQFAKGVTTTVTSWTASGRKFITGLFSYEI